MYYLDIMDMISLSNDFNLSFEKLPHAIRLIVSKNNEEWACRKEKLKNLFSFLETDKEHIFKGRLQLFKQYDRIDIQVKNIVIGTVSKESFEKTLKKLK